jgi:hypothetical protein
MRISMPRFETIFLGVGLLGASFLMSSSIILPYSNNNHAHRSTCELKTYIRLLQPHITFITELVGPTTVDATISWLEGVAHTMNKEAAQHTEKITDAADAQKLHALVDNVSWLLATKNMLIAHKAQLKADVASTLTRFPFTHVSQKVHSITVQRALTQLGSIHSSDGLLQCWDALVKFVENSAQNERFVALFADDIARQKDGSFKEQSLRCAYIAVKDISLFAYSFHVFFAQTCAHSFFNEQEFSALTMPLLPITGHHKSLCTILSDIFQIISIIEKLPIEQTLDAITQFIKKFSALINKIEQTSEGGFVAWLRSKWLLIPLSVSIIVIKAIQHFVAKDSVGEAGSAYKCL